MQTNINTHTHTNKCGSITMRYVALNEFAALFFLPRASVISTLPPRPRVHPIHTSARARSSVPAPLHMYTHMSIVAHLRRRRRQPTLRERIIIKLHTYTNVPYETQFTYSSGGDHLFRPLFAYSHVDRTIQLGKYSIYHTVP